MKKKILAICVVAILVITAITGASLAYLTDNEVAKNTFTYGNVDIRLDEEFVQESKLLPGIDVSKTVNVTNVGSEAAYVRVHIAIPDFLDSGLNDDPALAAYNNSLHWNFSKDSLADGLWNWHSTNKDGNTYAGYPENGGEWNFYQTTINDVVYNVYVATYETALTGKGTAQVGETTAHPAIYKVFLDAKLDNADMTAINTALNGDWSIYVAAEAVQAAGFANAYEAFEVATGEGNLSIDWSKAVKADTDKAQIDND